MIKVFIYFIANIAIFLTRMCIKGYTTLKLIILQANVLNIFF